MPTFRRPHTIHRAINSIVKQSFEDWELIVVDNDGDNYEFEDERIRYFPYTARQGAAYARNFGITLVEKDLICFFDDDDVMLPGYLEAFNNAFRDPTVMMARCKMLLAGRVVLSLGTPQVVMRTKYATPTWLSHTRHDQIYFTSIMDKNKWRFNGPSFYLIDKILVQALHNPQGGLRDPDGKL